MCNFYILKRSKYLISPKQILRREWVREVERNRDGERDTETRDRQRKIVWDTERKREWQIERKIERQRDVYKDLDTYRQRERERESEI